MIAKLHSAAVVGLDCELIEVEADICFGFPSFTIVGLPDTAIQEARDRVRSAIKNSGYGFPEVRITVNLAPANLKKEGALFDLALALSVLISQAQIKPRKQKEIFVGELSLEGKIRPIKGALALAMMAQQEKIKTIYLPAQNAYEASLIPGPRIIPLKNLKQLVAHLTGAQQIKEFKPPQNVKPKNVFSGLDMAYIKGQEKAKRVMEIAAAGAHNLLMTGPPGSGKTLLSKSMVTILPQMTWPEILETTRIYSVSGLLTKEQPLVNYRPFRAPHHGASPASIVGGGANPKPGEISLAHRGVLFLDEFPEFSRTVLEALRQPLEDKVITVSRVQQTATYPANVILVAAQNPCPCGYKDDPQKECTCSALQVNNYQRKVSGPLKDRLDLQITVPRVEFKKLSKKTYGESSALIQKRVERARKIQTTRFKDLEIMNNAEMSNQEIEKHCALDPASLSLLKQATQKLQLSPRAYFRIHKLARTIADLEQSKNIKQAHIAESLQYRE